MAACQEGRQARPLKCECCRSSSKLPLSIRKTNLSRLLARRIDGGASRMSSFWPLSPKICDGSHCWLRDRHPLRLCGLHSVKVA